MACSTAVTTNWTPSTSHITATSTTVITSIVTPTPSVSTTLITTCVATRRRSTRSVPTDRITIVPDVNDTSLEAATTEAKSVEDLTVAASRSRAARAGAGAEVHRRHRSKDASSTVPFLWGMIEDEPEQEIVKRQVPAGLPDNCVSWTVVPSLSTIPATPSTTLSTTTTLSSSITTIWEAHDTVFSACPTSTTESESAVPTSEATSSDTEAAQTTSSEVAESTESQSTPVESTSSTEPSPSSSGTWVDETSRLPNLVGTSSSDSATSPATSASSAAATVSMQTIDTSSNGTAVVPGVATSQASDTAHSSSRSTRTAAGNTSSIADAGAATQAALATESDHDKKAVSAGAAIGGVFGLLLFIGAILFALRWWMRRKRDNNRKTMLMRQSWYPPGFDGPDHIVDTAQEKRASKRGNHDPSSSFFTMGNNAVGNSPTGTDGLPPIPPSRRFPSLHMPKKINLPFFQHRRDDSDDGFSSEASDPVTMPALFIDPRKSPDDRAAAFPRLHTPYSPRKTPVTPTWGEAPASTAPKRTVSDRRIPRKSIMAEPGELMGPPKLNYEPAGGHMSWGLNQGSTSTPPAAHAALPLSNRPKLEWGHSYAASTVNPNPRQTIMPPMPQARGFVPGPQIPPSPTEDSVYSHRESQASRASTRQSKHYHNRFSRDPPPPAELNRKPSRLDNPGLRSAILNRASASVASLGHLSFQSGTTDHSLQPLPEGGLRLDFPLPPSPTSRAPSMAFPTPRISMQGNVPPPASRSLMPPRPALKPSTSAPASVKPSSSIFEYADYTRTSAMTGGPSESNGRDTIRQTADWYDKPLWVWDGQSGPLPPIPTDQEWDGSAWRQSQGRKSVRWDSGDGVARAL